MSTVAREEGGRGRYRRYSAEFKREQIERITCGDVMAAELSRELGIAHSQLQRWKYLLSKGGETAVASDEDVVPVSELRAAQQRIRELERALGRKQMAIEIFEAAQDEMKKSRIGTECRSADGAPRKSHLRHLGHQARHGVSPAHRAGATVREGRRSRGGGVHHDGRAGARELWRSPRDGGRESILRHDVQSEAHPARDGAVRLDPAAPREAAFNTRASRHRRRPRSNERWSSDAIDNTCWNGDVVQAAIALDCCDRECLAYVAAGRALTGADVRPLLARAVQHRFGDARPPQSLQWLSDNGSMYTALETVIAVERLGLTPITTPVCSPASNGISEAFHHTLRRDYLAGADLSRAAAVLDQIPQWIADYHHFAPHSSLGMRSPIAYRQAQELVTDTETSPLIRRNSELVSQSDCYRHEPWWSGGDARQTMPACLDHNAQMCCNWEGDSYASRTTEMPCPLLCGHVVDSRASYYIENLARVHTDQRISRQSMHSFVREAIARPRAAKRRTWNRDRCLDIELARDRVDPPSEVWRDLPAKGRLHVPAVAVVHARRYRRYVVPPAGKFDKSLRANRCRNDCQAPEPTGAADY